MIQLEGTIEINVVEFSINGELHRKIKPRRVSTHFRDVIVCGFRVVQRVGP